MKKVLSITLCILILAGMLCGCSKKASKKVTLREDLLEYGGDFWSKENKKTAEQFVTDIENAYNAYQKDKDLEDYADKVCTIINDNQAFILKLEESLEAAENQAKAQNDDVYHQIGFAKADMAIIAINNITLSFAMLPEMSANYTDEEIEQMAHDAVNAVTKAFCDTETAK